MEFEKKKETRECMPVDLAKRLCPIICFPRHKQEVQMFLKAERRINRLHRLGKRERQRSFCNSNIRHLSKFKISEAGRKRRTARRYLFPHLIKILDLKMNLKTRSIIMTKQKQEIMGQTTQALIILCSSV